MSTAGRLARLQARNRFEVGAGMIQPQQQAEKAAPQQRKQGTGANLAVGGSEYAFDRGTLVWLRRFIAQQLAQRLLEGVLFSAHVAGLFRHA